MTKVFISYSRKDEEFVHALNAALTAANVDPWVDRADIPHTADWWQEIQRGIEAADNFVFIISPASVASQVCAREVEHALQHNKRIVPVLRRDVDSKATHPEIARRNWLLFREEDDFHSSAQSLVMALNTDLEWVNRHTRLLTRALEWEQRGRNNAFLLRGADLKEAERWLGQSGSGKEPTSLQTQYIIASRRAESRRQRITTGSAIFGMIVASVLAFLAEANRRESNRQRKVALARQLAAQAGLIRDQRPDLGPRSLLLAIESMRRLPSLEAEQPLRRGLDLLAPYVMRLAHRSYVNDVAYSPDGKYIATASEDRTAKIWQASTGRDVASLKHDSPVWSVTFTPDGKYLLTTSWSYLRTEDKSVRVWEVESSSQVARIEYPRAGEYVIPLALNPDGRYLATSHGMVRGRNLHARTTKTSGTFSHHKDVHLFVQVHDVATGQEMLRIDRPIVNALAFSPDGKYLALDGEIWDIESNVQVSKIKEAGSVYALAYSPDGKYLAMVGEKSKDAKPGSGTAGVWDVSSGVEITRIDNQDDLDAVAFSPDGRYVVMAGEDGAAALIEVRSNRGIKLSHDQYVRDVDFSPDGKYVATASDDRTARVWDVQNGREVARMTHDARINGISFSPDSKQLATASDDSTVRIWQATSGQAVSNMTFDPRPQFVIVSPKGKYSAAVNSLGGIQLWDVAAEKEVVNTTYGSKVVAAAFSPDEQYLATLSGSESPHALHILDISSDREVATMTITGSAKGLAVGVGGKYVATHYEELTDGRNVTQVWEVTSGRQVISMTQPGRILALTFSADGKYISTSSGTWNTINLDSDGRRDVPVADPRSRVWEVATGAEVISFTHEVGVYTSAFSPNGKYLATGGMDNIAALWEISGGRQVMSMTHEAEVQAVAFSPDSLYVATASVDGAVRVWDIKQMREVARIERDDASPVFVLAFSEGGRYLSASTYDHAIYRWLWKTEDLIAEGCSRLPRNLNPDEWRNYLASEPYRKTCPHLP